MKKSWSQLYGTPCIRYFSIKSIRTYLYSIYIIKIMNLIMYHRNIYVNNHKFLLIIDNIIVLQLSSGLARSHHKNLPKVGGSLIIFRCLKVSSKPGIGQKSCAFVCFASLQMLPQLYFLKSVACFDWALHYIIDSPFIRLDARPCGAEIS